MEKIILGIDARQINTKALYFACYIANLTRSKLTGIFLENLPVEDVPVMKRLYGIPYVETIVAADIPGNDLKKKVCEQNIRLFREICDSKAVNCSVHRDKGVPAAELVAESRFADLLIADTDLSFRDKQEKPPSAFLNEVLAKSECPVVIAPSDFYGIDEILFAYDGNASSLFAIKQFTYLFPELYGKKITIMEVGEKGDLPITEKKKIGELLQMHYSSIGFQFLQGRASNELFAYLIGRKNVFVVMGAFGRNMLSAFFRPSTAELLVQTLDLPLFIAHH